MSNSSATGTEEFDRHSRRVLWTLPTGLYLIGSRHGDAVNLMTANLVVQVSLEPKLVAVALESESVTADLVQQGGAFSVTLLARVNKDIVRRFVKPVAPDGVVRADDGSVTEMAGHAIVEVGEWQLPALTAGIGHLVCRLTAAHPLGSHTLCIGEVTEVGGEPAGAEILRMEDTRMHYGG
jgi:flavin reductase (DIM6/NTAB) family NADH-FMN oxidoreductase RutF